MDWTQIGLALIAALGGGLASLFLLPEKKQAARLDNAERVIAKYETLLEEYKKQNDLLRKRVEELENKSKNDLAERDLRIKELEKQVRTLEDKLHSLEQKRGKDGRFVKNQID